MIDFQAVSDRLTNDVNFIADIEYNQALCLANETADMYD